MKFPARLACLAALALALPLAPPTAMAQDYPTKSIRVIAPVSAGGLTDIILRAMATKMSPVLNGQTVVVENMPGAGTMVGTAALARAVPDGYTWGIGASGALAANPHMQKTLPYNPQKDFAPVCKIGAAAYILVANPAFGVKTLPELLAKAKSGKVTFASPGLGSSPHMAQELFKAKVATPFLHVPYKGTAPAVNDTIAGHTQVLFEAGGPLAPHIKSGKLVAIGVTSGKRLASLPDVPTFEELGYKDIRLEGWIGIMLPAGTPQAIVTKASEACKTALAAPDVQAHGVANGFEVDYAGPAEFAAFIASEYQKWGDLIRLAGIKPE
ncbi:Bug family tripartite tricarboxylate transporter substrate binding protein [Ramlibacter sp.]|uniref:Bug family tripartite tricarboxylate transporter substrate binding protein n=1 Tax=Ramlibacter sp. TaxID=1917967 RepID=UPI003D111584